MGAPLLQDYDSSIETASHLIGRGPLNLTTGSSASLAALRAASHGAMATRANGNLAGALAYIESGLEVAERSAVEYLQGEPSDRLLQLETIAKELSSELDDNFSVVKAREFTAKLRDRVRVVDPDLLDRRIGRLASVVWEKYFAFVKLKSKDYFFHYRDLMNEQDWNSLTEDSQIAFKPLSSYGREPKALEPRLLS